MSSHFSETVFTNSFVSNFSARTVKEEDRCVTTVCCLTFFLEKEREKLRERMFVGECVCLCEKKTPSRDRIRRKKRDQRDRRDVKRTAAARLTDIYAEREREQKKYLSFSPRFARFKFKKIKKKIPLARRERTNLLHHRRNLRALLERGLSRGSSGRWRFRHRERLESNRRHFFCVFCVFCVL